MSLARKVIQIVKIRELRNSIMFVLGVLVIFRFAAHIPIPGINSENLASFFAGNEIFGLINIFSGGALESFSIVALGIAPYITSSIIFQLLQLVVPRLEELSKEGEQGRQKINQYTRMATVPLAALQGYGIIRILQGHSSQIISPTISIYELVTMIIILTTGTIFLMWLGELISERKIGNGISILIFAGIVSAIPTSIQTFIINYDPSQIQNIILFSGIALITIAAIVFITEGQRNVPVTYARRMRGTHMLGGTTAHLPLKVNQSGMIPIIFAFSLILFPPLIAQFLTRADSDLLARSGGFILRIFDPSHPFYITFFLLLVVGFTYFYTFVTFKPENIAENLQKQGAFIPGIRPGKNTEEYLNKIVSRIVLAGALFLGVVALLPFIIQAATGIGSVAISGASLLIVVGVVIEIQKQINAQLTMREYEGI
jgi:preprotein translocase subunit SecY